MCAFLQNARHLSAGQGNLFTALCQRGRSITERTLICAHAYLRACFFECTLLNYLSISGLENVVANSKLLFYLLRWILMEIWTNAIPRLCTKLWKISTRFGKTKWLIHLSCQFSLFYNNQWCSFLSLLRSYISNQILYNIVHSI